MTPCQCSHVPASFLLINTASNKSVEEVWTDLKEKRKANLYCQWFRPLPFETVTVQLQMAVCTCFLLAANICSSFTNKQKKRFMKSFICCKYLTSSRLQLFVFLLTIIMNRLWGKRCCWFIIRLMENIEKGSSQTITEYMMSHFIQWFDKCL